MKITFRAMLVASVLAIPLVAGSLARADDASQAGASAVVQHTPYTWADVAKWPDLGTGLWSGGGGGGPPGPPAGGGGARAGGAPGAGPGGAGPGGGPGGGMPLRADYSKAMAARRKEMAKTLGKTYGNCEPMGVIADSGSKFYIGKDVIVIGGLSDWYNPWRRIYMNRTAHDDPEPSYFGDSIGHWEGKTLVIDTVAVRAQAQVMQQEPVGNNDTHIVERITLLNPNTLQWDKTVYNPGIFTKPWHTVNKLTRDTDDGDFVESYCWQDRDQSGNIDLTPPPE